MCSEAIEDSFSKSSCDNQKVVLMLDNVLGKVLGKAVVRLAVRRYEQMRSAELWTDHATSGKGYRPRKVMYL